MGAMLMTGSTLAGACLAIALIARSVRGPSATLQVTEPSPAGRLAIVAFAFAEGIAVLSVVQGLLTIFADGLSDPNDGLFAGVPAVAGALVGLAVISRDRAELDRRTSFLGMSFILGLGLLGGVVAALAFLTFERSVESAPDLAYVVLGGGSALTTLAIGFAGSAVIRGALAHGAPSLDDPTAYKTAIDRLAKRCFPFLALGWATCGAAILLVALE